MKLSREGGLSEACTGGKIGRDAAARDVKESWCCIVLLHCYA